MVHREHEIVHRVGDLVLVAAQFVGQVVGDLDGVSANILSNLPYRPRESLPCKVHESDVIVDAHRDVVDSVGHVGRRRVHTLRRASPGSGVGRPPGCRGCRGVGGCRGVIQAVGCLCCCNGDLASGARLIGFEDAEYPLSVGRGVVCVCCSPECSDVLIRGVGDVVQSGDGLGGAPYMVLHDRIGDEEFGTDYPKGDSGWRSRLGHVDPATFGSLQRGDLQPQLRGEIDDGTAEATEDFDKRTGSTHQLAGHQEQRASCRRARRKLDYQSACALI